MCVYLLHIHTYIHTYNEKTPTFSTNVVINTKQTNTLTATQPS